MKTFPFVIALPLFAASFAHAGPILTPPASLNQALSLEDVVVGQFELQESGNQITGDYQLTQTDSANSYLVQSQSGNEIVGEFKLTVTGMSGSFQLEQSSSNQNDYQLVESGSETVGTYLQEQGNLITGEYQLLDAPGGAATPEPGTLGMATMGAGLLVLGGVRRRRMAKAGSAELVTLG